MSAPIRRITYLSALLTAFALLKGPGPAVARESAASLAESGHFSSSSVRCQQALGRAATLCAHRAISKRDRCLSAEMRGRPCDREALESSNAAAEARLAVLVARRCANEDLQLLGHSNLTDAVDDISQVCRETETAATSALWGPALVSGRASAPPGRQRRCIENSARIGARLLRLATLLQQRALNKVATEGLTLEEKTGFLERTRTMIDRLRQHAAERLSTRCSTGTFEAIYGRNVESMLEGITDRGECLNQRMYIVEGATHCPPPACGNGMVERGEECDDGNDREGDTCTSACTKTDCEAFANTYDLIQKAIFEHRGCTSELCHSSVNPAGALDLSAGVSYANLVNVPATTADGFKLVEPGNRANSLLWINVAAKLGDGLRAPLRAMPLGPDALSADEVEVLRLWIEDGGATRRATVPGAAEVLGACVLGDK